MAIKKQKKSKIIYSSTINDQRLYPRDRNETFFVCKMYQGMELYIKYFG